MLRQVAIHSHVPYLERALLSNVGIMCARRYIANEYKEVQPIANYSGDNTKRSGNSGGSSSNNSRDGSKQQTGQSNYSHAPPPAQPPSTTFNEQFLPMDFNPHIEFFEYPKEMFSTTFPYTREQCIRSFEETLDSTTDEAAMRYGIRFQVTSKLYFWLCYGLWVFMNFTLVWSLYRGVGSETTYFGLREIIKAQPNAPTVEDDELYLDWWLAPEEHEMNYLKEETWRWKPPVKRDRVHTSWEIPMHYPDVSEWKHMVSEY